MAIRVIPRVILDGETVASTAAALDSAPVAIEGLSIDWGRGDYHDADTSPASLSLTLTDATGEWADRIRNRRAIGRRVEIEWTGQPTTPGGVLVGPVVMFRGRIQEARAVPMDRWTDDGRRRWRIELTCADRTADYGNAFFPELRWGRDTMEARAYKIMWHGREAGSGIDAVYFWPGYQETRTAPIETQNRSALDLLAELYQSMGNDSYSYDPDENVIRQAIRLSQPYSVHLGSFDDDLGAVTPVVDDITVDEVVYPGVSLGGRALIGTPEVVADPATDINRLECSWEDYSTGHDGWTTVHEDVAEGDSRRVMSWDSWIDDGLAIDPTLENVWARVTEEGRRPRHPELETWPSHEFTTGRLARWILQTWENTRPAYIAGSLAYEWLLGDEPDYSPVVAPIGGTTTFDPIDGWSVQFRVHWIHNQSPMSSPATWAGIQQMSISSTAPSVPWWWSLIGLPVPPPVPVGDPVPERDLTWGPPESGAGYRFAESVTWGDLRHVPDDTAHTITDHLE